MDEACSTSVRLLGVESIIVHKLASLRDSTVFIACKKATSPIDVQTALEVSREVRGKALSQTEVIRGDIQVSSGQVTYTMNKELNAILEAH